MRRYVGVRLAQIVLTIFCLITLQFFLFRSVPGDPIAAYIDQSLPIETREAIRRQFGLDESLWRQYVAYVFNLCRGELGVSFHYREPVAVILPERLWNTVLLLAPAIVVSLVVGSGVGAVVAWLRGRPSEIAGVFFALLLRSIPEFWLCLMALMIFAYWLEWLPLGGTRSIGMEVTGLFDKFLSFDFLWHLILPSLCAAAALVATPLLVMRNSMLEVIRDDFIDFAKAKGLRPTTIIFRHAMPNALLPVVTILSVMTAVAIGGDVLIETIFRWPGIGRELVLAIQRRDFPMAQGIFLLMGLFIVTMNFIVDLLYGYLDPRVTYQ